MLNSLLFKSSKIFFVEKISFLVIKKNKFLVLKTTAYTKFFLISNFISCSIINNTLFVSSKDGVLLSAFIKSLLHFKKLLSVKSKKKLRLSGLGFKLNLLPSSPILGLKIGSSHSVNVLVPSDIALSVKKNVLIADGFNRTNLGNFLGRVRNLKVPDAYKGKGFWYASEKESLKQIKKK
jgi:hypothetical protein